jgi:hypothetical protein
MKKLLHLYNYGHNPFPKIGRGGLGYHLPQYKLRGLGIFRTFNEDGDMVDEYEIRDGDPTIYDQYLNDDDEDDEDDDHEVPIEVGKYEHDPETGVYYYHLDPDIYEDYEPEYSHLEYEDTEHKYTKEERNDLKSIEKEKYRKLLSTKTASELNDLLIEQGLKKSHYKNNPQRIEALVKLFKPKGVPKSINLLTETDESINNRVKNDIYKMSLRYHSDAPNFYFLNLKRDLENIIENLNISEVERKIYNDKLKEIEKYENEIRAHFGHLPTKKELRDYLLKKGNLNDIEKNILQMYEKHDSELQDEQQKERDEEQRIVNLISNMSSLSLDEQYKINLVEYDKFIDYHNKLIREQTKIKHPDWSPQQINEECSGKGYEIYLCTTGKSLIDKNTNSTSPIINNDDNQLIPSGLRKYASIDLFNDVAMIECKEYSSTSSTDEFIPLQYTKLCGYNPFKIVFNENGKIVEFSENDKNILPPSSIGRDYKVYYKLKDGIYMYNVSESIRNYTKKIAGGQKNARIIFDESDIKTGKLGSFCFDNGTRLKDHNGKLSINIKKKYLHKII